MMVIRHVVTAVGGNDIQIVMSAWPHLARTKQGAFERIVRIGDAVRTEDRLQAVLVESFVVRHERHFAVQERFAEQRIQSVRDTRRHSGCKAEDCFLLLSISKVA